MTPTFDAITDIYVAADAVNTRVLAARNCLLIDWYVQAGLRRMEAAALVTAKIPEWELIDSLRQKGKALEVQLDTTKGGRVRHVGILPDLLEKSREYIEGPRKEIVERFRQRKGTAYEDPPELFLSWKTGRQMGLRSITNLMTSWFKKATVGGHGHRLRAAYLTNLFEAEIAAEEMRIVMHPGTKLAIDYELILRKVAERAGHKDISSLRPYLTLTKKRQARSDGGANFVTLQQRVEFLRREAALLERKIEIQRSKLERGDMHSADKYAGSGGIGAKPVGRRRPH